jgi:hypothetical protein
MISKWRQSRDSHASHLLNGMIDKMEDYKSISAQYKLCLEVLIDLNNLASGVEDDDDDQS